eukprot:CAMPEP_0202734434 /NCGR_PEP_ID=MMETSP1385-20130828/188680_1 /ASSEMBLY_ACC=CAM_ASM_000861 /TAXON_ID=933848 /ORGANISM="Elphidium margaritaceum" /LENGTH=1139 /DNA_ID=CAMNT_0049400795 /DNA_START=109 /DNA_END=3528 /DNA_ORIENTATION=+
MFLACLLLVAASAETINRDMTNDYSVVACTEASTPCIINCNAASSCRATTISCGSSASCTINLNAAYAAYASTITVGDIKSLTITADSANYALKHGVVNVGSLSGDLTIQAEGTSLEAFYSLDLNVAGVGGNLVVQESPLAGGGRSFAFLAATVAGNVVGNATFAAWNDLGRLDYQPFDISRILLKGSVGGSARFISNMYGTFSENYIEITGSVSGNVEFLDTSAYGRGFCCNPLPTYGIKILGPIGGDLIIRDESTDGHAGYNTDFVFGPVLGDVEVFSSSDSSFEVSTDVCCAPTSSSKGFFFPGTIFGSVRIRDGSTDGHGGYNTDFVFGPVLGDVEVFSSSDSSFEVSSFVFGDVAGSMTFNATGYVWEAFMSMQLDASNIGGDFVMEERPDITRGKSFITVDVHVSGDVGGTARFQAFTDSGTLDRQAFDISKIRIDGSVGGDALFLSNNYGTFSENYIKIGGDIGGDLVMIDTSTHGRGFCCAPTSSSKGFFFPGTIFGSVRIRDGSTDGHGGYNTDFVFGPVLGDVEVFSSSDSSFEVSSFVFGDVAGSMTFNATGYVWQAFMSMQLDASNIGGDFVMEERPDITRGKSFITVDVHVSGDVGGTARFQAFTDSGTLDLQAFDISKIRIDGSVGGDALFLSNNYGTFSENYIKIGGDIGGDLVMIDTSTHGRGFCCAPTSSSYGFFFPGTISGSVRIRDGSTDGYAGYNSDFYFGPVLGDVEVVDNATGPYAYYSTIFEFEAVAGTVLFESLNDWAMAAMETTFGSGVGSVGVVVDGGKNALYTAVFDAREADDLALHCNNDADCSDVNVYCPADNRDNKCRVYCSSSGTNCGYIDLFTTNGYCADASFYCLDTADPTSCNFGSTDKVYCVYDSYAYGQASSNYCAMDTDDVNGGFFCQDVGSAQCSSEVICPLASDTTAPPTTTTSTTTTTTREPTASPTTTSTTTTTTSTTSTTTSTDKPTQNPTTTTTTQNPTTRTPRPTRAAWTPKPTIERNRTPRPTRPAWTPRPTAARTPRPTRSGSFQAIMHVEVERAVEASPQDVLVDEPRYLDGNGASANKRLDHQDSVLGVLDSSDTDMAALPHKLGLLISLMCIVFLVLASSLCFRKYRSKMQDGYLDEMQPLMKEQTNSYQ